MTVNYVEIGNRIRKLRKEKGLTQLLLGEKINMTATHVSHIENGTTQASLPTLVAIANVLDTTMDHLLSDSVVNSEAVLNQELAEFLEGCSVKELRFLLKVMPTVVDAARSTDIIAEQPKEK